MFICASEVTSLCLEYICFHCGQTPLICAHKLLNHQNKVRLGYVTPVRSGLLYGLELMFGISLLYLLNNMLDLPCQRDHPHVILEAHLSCKTAKYTASCPHIHHHLSLKVCNNLHDGTLVGTSSCAVLVKAAAAGNVCVCYWLVVWKLCLWVHPLVRLVGTI